MTHKNLCILDFISSDNFQNRKTFYKKQIQNKKLDLDNLILHVLNEVWHQNKFDFWGLEFPIMRYYREFTRDVLTKELLI